MTWQHSSNSTVTFVLYCNLSFVFYFDLLFLLLFWMYSHLTCSCSVLELSWLFLQAFASITWTLPEQLLPPTNSEGDWAPTMSLSRSEELTNHSWSSCFSADRSAHRSAHKHLQTKVCCLFTAADPQLKSDENEMHHVCLHLRIILTNRSFHAQHWHFNSVKQITLFAEREIYEIEHHPAQSSGVLWAVKSSKHSFSSTVKVISAFQCQMYLCDCF